MAEPAMDSADFQSTFILLTPKIFLKEQIIKNYIFCKYKLSDFQIKLGATWKNQLFYFRGILCDLLFIFYQTILIQGNFNLFN